METCPFCKWQIKGPITAALVGNAVECPNCCAVGPPGENEADAIAEWNARPTADLGEDGDRLVELLRQVATRDGYDVCGRAADRIELYREALAPFALAADDLDDKHGDHSELWEAPAAMSITAGDLRRARAVLKR